MPRASLGERLNKENNSGLHGWYWKFLGKEEVTWELEQTLFSYGLISHHIGGILKGSPMVGRKIVHT